MSDALLTPGQLRLRDEARLFVKQKVPRQLLIDMDAEKVRYPREYIEKLAARNLYSLPSIVGEAIHVFGTREQKEKYLQPMLAGKLTVTEAVNPKGDPANGAQLFATNCVSCHGVDGKGGIANPGSADGFVPARGARPSLCHASLGRPGRADPTEDCG